ncbi:MAG: DUF3089 domain-containing protein [Myxococcales bacterium]|nr:DUF3089 domain-containing protein [Myxococcales bacterium]
MTRTKPAWWQHVLAGIAVIVFVLSLWWMVGPNGRRAYLRRSLRPAAGFAKFTPPPAPDYTKTSAWAELPEVESYADLSPADLPLYKTPPADVFFVHPTTFLSRKGWNGPIDDAQAKRRVDHSVMKYQASAFRGCCRIFAPRYRQATLYFAIARNDDAWKALELAYSDVVRAFRHFLKSRNQGRPFFIAGHSQGSMHALRLLETFPDEGGWRKRLIAAYLVGINVPLDKFKRTIPWLHPCQSPTDTRCVVGWTTLGREADLRGWANVKVFYPKKGYEDSNKKPRLCTNPLTWKTDEALVKKDQHKGALPYGRGKTMTPLAPQLVEAACQKGALLISTPPPAFRRLMLRPHDYHVYDYSLFFADVWHNARLRMNTFLKKK